MSQEFEAVYSDGVLKPIVPLPFAENERVLVSAASIDEEDREATLAAIRAGLADIAAGRTQPFDEFDRELRAKHGWPQRP
jgi:predicted DNA-binding antitoxin AbrB/MazE fold protein